jgi:hypothetical protein
MRGLFPPLESDDDPSWSTCDGRVGTALPKLMCDSGRAGDGGKGM